MKRIEPTSQENRVVYPDHVSEFEVQAELFFALKGIPELDVRGEVKSRGTHGLRPAKTACRFDIVPFVGEKALCIVEVKGGHVKHKTAMEDTRQGTRYPTYGIPVLVCYGMSDVAETVEAVRQLLA